MRNRQSETVQLSISAKLVEAADSNRLRERQELARILMGSKHCCATPVEPKAQPLVEVPVFIEQRRLSLVKHD